MDDRYGPTRDREIEVRVEHNGSDGGSGCSTATLIDISAGDARILSPNALPLDHAFDLHIHISQLSIDRTVAATVASSRPGHLGNWHIGCSFADPLPDGTLTRMAELGYLERRRSERQRTHLPGMLRVELVEAETHDVQLTDLSQDGFRITAQVPININNRVLVELETEEGPPVRVMGHCLWRLKDLDGYRAGCCFLNSEAHAQVRRLAQVRK